MNTHTEPVLPELLPCPCCKRDMNLWQAFCVADHRDTDAKIIAAWNQRAEATASWNRRTVEETERIVAQLESVLPEIEFGRETHVVWRDWLRKDPNNVNVNPHAGDADFHDKTVGEYDARLKAIRDAIVYLRTPAMYAEGKADAESIDGDTGANMKAPAGRIRFDYTNGDGNPDCKIITHDEMRQRYADLHAMKYSGQAEGGEGYWPQCHGCGKPLLLENLFVDDGCPCNTPRGVNLTPKPCALCQTDNCVKPGHRIAEMWGHDVELVPAHPAPRGCGSMAERSA